MNMTSTAIGNTNMTIAQAAWLRSVSHHQIRVEAFCCLTKAIKYYQYASQALE